MALRRLETASLLTSFGTVLGALSLSLSINSSDIPADDTSGTVGTAVQKASDSGATGLHSLVVNVAIIVLHGFVGLAFLQVRTGAPVACRQAHTGDTLVKYHWGRV
eukprot:SAG31_NODE_17635_length_663_cov_1.627660_1_plen_106_part_00